jgi:membrane protease YdiL (CAAX protease family)
VRTQSGFLRRHSLIIGLALMFLFTWPQDLANSGVIPIKLPFLVYLFLGWGFVVAALLMTWLTLGRPVVGELLRRYLKGHVGWKWYLALLIVPAVQALGLLLYSLFTRTPINLGHVLADDLRPPSVSRLAFVLPFFILDAIANGEEIGWRGYVLPRLQARHNALVAALVLGLIWALWHVPKLLTHWDWPYFAVFALDTVAKSLLLAWLYNNTGGSLLLVVLAHAAWNTLSIFLPVASTLSSENLGAYASQAVLEVLVAVLIVALAGAENLSRSRTRQHQT